MGHKRRVRAEKGHAYAGQAPFHTVLIRKKKCTIETTAVVNVNWQISVPRTCTFSNVCGQRRYALLNSIGVARTGRELFRISAKALTGVSVRDM